MCNDGYMRKLHFSAVGLGHAGGVAAKNGYA